MTELRERMIAQMKQRGFSIRTHQSYLHAVTELAGYYKRSPESINLAEIQRFFDHLVQERELAPASVRVYLNAVRFLYLKVLEWEQFDVPVTILRKPQRIPHLLSRQEISTLIASIDNLKHRTLILTCYGCGLRLSELVGLQVNDIDGERRLLRVQQGKGQKDRAVILSDGVLRSLREYWSVYRPVRWLFPNRDPLTALHVQSAQRIYTKAKHRAGIEKVGGIHALRHAYATHQLEAGMPVYQLQQMLGHNNIKSTMRYVHWIHSYKEGRGAVTDLVSALGGVNESLS